ncbi:hypothetical protein Poli38472_005315 [Pythium oligandrum]|uniref:Ankyrin repeat protein n=1 Tax=Pythium oligandrum TaxID=41045 RepID=A0A8K1CID7_PYTOL|nr:hypothetical protein Poli38472_005315 [Pythium oligandrum]|eukprot:TMW62697.1 hypothetical protein Poli38472_005315 [Pythium oligandrum]
MDMHDQRLRMTTCMARVHADIAALDHVLDLIDTCLDMSVYFNPPRAVMAGSIRLFDRVAKRVLASDADPALIMYWFAKAMETAASRDDLAMVRRVHYHHPTRLPVKIITKACERGNLELIRWVVDNRTDDVCVSDLSGELPAWRLDCCLKRASMTAIRCGHFHVLRWLYERGLIRNMDQSGDKAAADGDFEMVKWLHEINAPGLFTVSAMDKAASNGHLEIVRFLHENRQEGYTSTAMVGATVDGHQEVVNFLREIGAEEEVTWQLVHEAAHAGRLDILQWNNYAMRDRQWLQTAMTAAFNQGNLEVIQFLVERRRINCRPSHLETAATKGDLGILQWVHEKRCGEWSTTVMGNAARHGHLSIVQWLHNNRSEGCTTYAMDGAAREGHLEVVVWLHENRTEGCTATAMNESARNGHLDVVKWLHSNRTEGCTKAAMDGAAQNGHVTVLEWLHENRTEGCTTNAMDYAALYDHLEAVIWLHENRSEGCTKMAMDYGTEPVVRWLHFHRQEGATTRAMTRASRDGNLALLDFLYTHRTEGMAANAASMVEYDEGHLPINQWIRERYPDQ